MSSFTKMMGWDQIKEDASMMKGQGQELMGMSRDMFGRGKGFLSGKGEWYDSAMQSFNRSHMDTAGATGRNITRNFAAKGAGGGFAGLINQNMQSQQRMGEASSGFFSGLYRQGAQIGSDLQKGSQGFSGQANQALSKGADLSKARSDISTGLLNSAIGLGGGLLAQGMANKGGMAIANTMMGNPASAAASSKPGLFKRGMNLLGFNQGGGGSGNGMPFAQGAMNHMTNLTKPTGGFGSMPQIDTGRFSLDNRRNDGASNMLPGGWMRQITDWQKSNRGFEPPEPGAGNYWQNK